MQARGDVVVLAATNRPDLMDAALLRPGRFDTRLYVPPPVDVADRTAILGVLTRRTPLGPDADLAALGQLTPGCACHAHLSPPLPGCACNLCNPCWKRDCRTSFEDACDMFHVQA